MPTLDKKNPEVYTKAVVQATVEQIQKIAKMRGVKPYEVTYDMFANHATMYMRNRFQFELTPNRREAFEALRDEVFVLKTFNDVLPKAAPKAAKPTIQKPEVAAEVEEFETKIVERDAKRIQGLNVREEAFLQRFENLANTMLSGQLRKIKAIERMAAQPEEHERIVNLLLSDLHIRALLDAREVNTPYGPHEEARRLGAVTLQAGDYKLDHRADSVLYMYLLGDIIQGVIHDLRDGAPTAEQVAAAIYLLTQVVVYLAQLYKRVYIFCTPGNHGRNPARHKDRAVNQRWDAIETMIYYGIKMAVAHLPNVKVEIPYKPYIDFYCFKMRAFGTHGDAVLNVGFPNSSINVKSIEQQINRINASLPDRDEYKLFFVGHVHVGSIVHLGNGSELITNGALVPPDSYASSIGLFENQCGQTLWETTPKQIVGDYRFIKVGQETDKDAGLELIVKPFESF
jgi:hypothetical protein